jgi:hypothetical protein
MSEASLSFALSIVCDSHGRPGRGKPRPYKWEFGGEGVKDAEDYCGW